MLKLLCMAALEPEDGGTRQQRSLEVRERAHDEINLPKGANYIVQGLHMRGKDLSRQW
jgi:hypothetical protein